MSVGYLVGSNVGATVGTLDGETVLGELLVGENVMEVGETVVGEAEGELVIFTAVISPSRVIFAPVNASVKLLA